MPNCQTGQTLTFHLWSTYRLSTDFFDTVQQFDEKAALYYIGNGSVHSQTAAFKRTTIVH